MRRREFLLGAVAASAVPAVAAPSHARPASAARAQAARRSSFARVKSWAIQYRHIDVFEVAASPHDLVVIDYRPDLLFGTEWPFSRRDVRLMQRKPDGGRRLVVAYLSVGEAEDYRWYWQRAWSRDPASRPAWIGKENPRWSGNFPVQFWEPGWQSILLGGPESYLDKILAAGFDGVYLDRCDVYQELEAGRKSADRDMVDLVARIGDYAHTRNPAFLVIMQNAEELTTRPALRAVLDGFAKEDLFFGLDHDGRRNTGEAVAYALAPIRALRQAGIKTLLVEYPLDAPSADEIRARAKAEGLTLLLADRRLAALAPLYPPPDQAAR